MALAPLRARSRLQTVINLGIAFFLARIVNAARDTANLVPVVIRLARYVSGVFFSITHYAGHGLVSMLLLYQPLAVTMTIGREALMDQYPLTWSSWAAGSAPTRSSSRSGRSSPHSRPNQFAARR